MSLPTAFRSLCPKMSVIKSASALLLITLSLFSLRAGSTTAGDLILLVAGASASNTTGSLVEINTSSANQSAVQSIAIPGTGTDAYRISGSATSTGYVSSSNDRSLLTFTGANSTDTSTNVNALNPRGVYTLSSTGTIVKQTTYTGANGNQTRSATSLNNTSWFIADQGGFYTNGGTSASPSANPRAIKSFGGTVYFGQQSSTAANIQVATLSATSGGTVAGLPGLTNNNSFQDFYLVQSGSNGTAYDLLYVVSNTSATAGTIAKYSLVSGSWTANGSYTTTFGGFGLAAAATGSGASLYVTTGAGATTANSVIKVTDTAGYNTTISVTTANNVTLYTTGTGTIIKALDFAPQAVVAAPGISQQPQSQTIAPGQTATLTVTASGTAPLSYQWYQGLSGTTTTPVGTNSPSFITPALTATTSYWVRITNGQGGVDSATATITVSSTVAPGISQQPQSQTIASGQTATLTVGATGTAPLTYQWYQGTASATTTPVGTNSPSFTTPVLTATTSYWVRVSNSASFADSATAVITVTSGSTSPTGTGSAVLSVVPAGGTTQLTVNVTPGTNPDSTNIAVTGDLSSIGGSNARAFAGSGNTFSYLATVDPATTLGPKSLPITVSDAQGRSTSFNISLTVTAPVASSPIVISQVYGGGGNTGASYTNDFVQLYNRGSTTIDTAGWSLQYAPATGTGDWTGRQPLGGQIAPGQYYLIALASGGANGSQLPPANVNGQINISQTAGKLALVDNGDLLTGAGGCAVSTHIQDLVGYGSTADCWEGSASATVSSPLTAIALFRQGSGTVDTNDNKSDFITGTPNAFTTTPIVPLPPQVFTTYPVSNGTDIPRDATIEVTFTAPITVDSGWFNIVCATTGVHNDATEAPDGTNRWITPNVNFVAGESCTVTVFKAKVHDAGSLTPPQDYSWSFTVASGAAPPEPPTVHLLMGNPTNAVTDINQPANYLMSKPEYAMSYNRDLGRPNWVSWHLTNAWIPTSHPARVDTFRPDPGVPALWYRVQSFDFSGSGFDRGHLDPNADRESSIPVNQATFLMSNMMAQAPANNQGPWGDLEDYLRSVVRSTPANEIYIVAGPAGTGGAGSNGAANTIANGHVTVPAFTWKVALVLSDNGGTDDISRVNCSTTALAVIMPNTQSVNSDWHASLTTVNAVETLTGYHFFTNLPQPIQNCIKAGINGNNPKNDQTITFPPFAGMLGDVPLQATASSGLAIAYSVVSGSAIVNGSTLHITGAGPVTIKASQPGDVNYNAATDVSQTVTVARAAATIQVTGGTFAYDGQPHGLTGTATGVFGENLSSLLTLGSTFTNPPGGRAFWAFDGNANYLPASGTAVVTITQAGAPAYAFIPGNLVVAVEGNGVAGAVSGPFTDNQASPLTLFQFAPNGTTTAAYVSSLVLPQTGSGANLAVSAEYGSSSEGTLHLSGLGQYLTIAGYGVKASDFNANPALYGTDPAKPNALAQSGSLTGAGYTPVSRVVALIDPFGNVNSSTGIFNVFNTNNPRSVYTADGTNLYVSGQGTGNDLTGGVFYTTLGSHSATAITGATAASNNPPPANIAQETRDVQIVGGQLYVAMDTKEGTGSNRDYIGTLGTIGNPPTTLTGAPVRISGFGNSGGTGKLTVTAANTNGINSSGQEVNLSPVSFFFANSTTLYVADSGQPKNDSVTNDSNGVTLGAGGLQKWVLNAGTWSLQYTLGLQNGLPLVPNVSAAGVTGLYGLTGKVVGGEVLLYATTYSKNDLDQTYLFGFTDILAATTNPGNSFTQLAAAPADSNFKGVAFAPSVPSGGITVTSTPSGLTFTSAGAGCAPGTYTTPVTLIWTPGNTCTLQAASPQAADGFQYGFGSWTGGGSSSGSATLTVTAPLLPTVFNAGFKILPLITWPAPAAIKFGSALSGTQLNATANIPGTFVYNPPAGTVLPVGAGQPLSATFTPVDTTVYATVTVSNSITITPASSGPVNLIVTNVLRRSDGNVVAQITIANTGGTDATNVVLTNAKVGAVTATPLPQTIGTIAAGASAQIMVSVPGSVGSSGAASSLVVNGTYTGGVFSSSARVTLP